MADAREMTLGDFLEQLGSEAPAPGGGAVAALAAAQAAALVAMVAGITGAKRKQDSAGWQGIRDRAETLGRQLAALVDRDTQAFLGVMSAYRLPRDDSGRPEAIRSALRQAALVPLEVARRSVEVMDLARVALERGIASARTDAGVALLMGRTALEGAALNVLVNLGGLGDGDFVRETTQEVNALRTKGREFVALVDALFDDLQGELKGV
ncbi:MAG: cyclodeaminase/cyclohydrolase family protein [Bacillota bacterium]